MKANNREICCDRCRRVVGQLATQSKWRRGTIALCSECQEFDGRVSGKVGVVDELRKIFGMRD